MVRIVYAVLSILVVGLVIVFGAGWKSNFVPKDNEDEDEHRLKEEEPSDSTN